MFSRPVEDLIDTSQFPTGLVEVRDDPVRGRGVYAKKDIPEGVKICFTGGILKVGRNKKTIKIGNNKILPLTNAPCFDVLDSSCQKVTPLCWTKVKKDSLPPLSLLNDKNVTAFVQTSDTVTNSLAIGQFIRPAGQLKPDESNINDSCEIILVDASKAANCTLFDDNICLCNNKTCICWTRIDMWLGTKAFSRCHRFI